MSRFNSRSTGFAIFNSASNIIGDSDNGGVSATALMIAPLERYQLPTLPGNQGVHAGSSVPGDLAIFGTLQPANAGVGVPAWVVGVPATSQPVMVNGNYVVTNSSVGAQMFYQLRSP
ncbi:MAG TPA: hypothetical protein VH597_09550 [Verrucomicrobiae bacterium]|jgi:hypothetical protein|nr:hypothetical protein [Verrucomicrobiae bacterium]